jgi:ABC-2 type transport system ATP-binding protein
MLDRTDGMIIDTHGLAKRYGNTHALVDLTLQVGPAEVFGFLGPNGAGKTTAVSLLLGMTRPTSGTGAVLDAPIGDRAARRQIGYLPELFRYQPWMRAREVLELHARLIDGGRRRTIDASAIDGVLDEVGLADRATDVVGTYSKGMQQRLGLGVALLGDPALVILDEPTSALDPIGRADVREIIGRARERGAAVFLNSHLLTEVERVCDRVAIVDHGRVLALGRLDDLLGDPVARLHVTDLPDGGRDVAGAFGTVVLTSGGWLSISPIDPSTVPDLVAAIVTAGGRVHGVEVARATLEDRFIDLIGRAEARMDERAP